MHFVGLSDQRPILHVTLVPLSINGVRSSLVTKAPGVSQDIVAVPPSKTRPANFLLSLLKSTFPSVTVNLRHAEPKMQILYLFVLLFCQITVPSTKKCMHFLGSNGSQDRLEQTNVELLSAKCVVCSSVMT